MLSVKGLTKVYENGVEALRGVSFDTSNCGMIAIVGSSGCGKSTLLNVLSGIDEKSDGEIFINGELCNPRELKSTFATIYQDYKLIENLSVIDNIMIAKELNASDYTMEQIDELLVKLGIEKCKNEKVLSLSGGQKQRVAIARAMIQQPKIIFADEPTGNLDSKNSKNIFGLLQELAKDILIIVVTHDVETIRNYANRIIRLQDGLIIDDEEIVGVNAREIEQKSSAYEVEEKVEEAQNEVEEKSDTSEIEEKVEEQPKNNVVKKAKKGGLSVKTAMSVAVAFNKAKVGRRIAFMVITTVLLMILMFCCNWASIDYESMVRATYDKRNVGNMAVSRYSRYDKVSRVIGNGSFTTTMHNDLTEICQYLKDKKGISSAKVYTNVTDIFGIDTDFTGTMTYNINEEMLNLQDVAYGYAFIDKYIVTNDLKSLGINLIKGRQPEKLGEVAIPKSKYIYFNSVGGYRDRDTGEYVEVKDIFEHNFYGIRIVGVFDDGVVVPDKYAKPISEFKSEEEQEAYNYVTEKILAQSVVVSTAWSDVWDATMYLEHPGYVRSSQGQYVHTTMNAADRKHNNIGVAPANALTANITGIDSVEKGSVVMSEIYAKLIKVNDGDDIVLSTQLIRGDIGDLSGEYTIDRNIRSNIKFKVKVDANYKYNSGILYNEEDYKMMMGGYEKPQTNKIIFNMDSLSASELKQLNAKAKHLYGGKSYDNYYQSRLDFIVDDGGMIPGEFAEMRMIGNYVFIAGSLILAFVVGLLIYNSISVIITSKANDLLILKSLGAKKLDYFKIYGIFTIIQLVIELIIGIGFGIGIVFLLDYLMTTVIGQTLICQLPLVPISILITILIALVAGISALTLNICRISDKNLRKAFQKTKE